MMLWYMMHLLIKARKTQGQIQPTKGPGQEKAVGPNQTLSFCLLIISLNAILKNINELPVIVAEQTVFLYFTYKVYLITFKQNLDLSLTLTKVIM